MNIILPGLNDLLFCWSVDTGVLWLIFFNYKVNKSGFFSTLNYSHYLPWWWLRYLLATPTLWRRNRDKSTPIPSNDGVAIGKIKRKRPPLAPFPVTPFSPHSGRFHKGDLCMGPTGRRGGGVGYPWVIQHSWAQHSPHAVYFLNWVLNETTCELLSRLSSSRPGLNGDAQNANKTLYLYLYSAVLNAKTGKLDFWWSKCLNHTLEFFARTCLCIHSLNFRFSDFQKKTPIFLPGVQHFNISRFYPIFLIRRYLCKDTIGLY